MRWPWPKREPRDSEATRARVEAQAELERVKAETAQYAALGASLRKIRQENHLTELFQQIPHRRHS